MATAINSGPNITTGSTDSAQLRDSDSGPDVNFQGTSILDPRYVGSIGAAPGIKISAIFANPYFAVVDGVPQPAGNAKVAALANVTNGTAMTLAATQGAGVSPNIPIVPFGQSFISTNVVTPGIALDFGFTTASTTSGSTTLTIPVGAWRNFKLGQRIIVSGAGATVTTPLFTTIAATVAPYATTVTMANAAGQTVANTQVGSSDQTGIAAQPYAFAGAIALADPTQNIARGLSVTGVASGTGGAFLIKGYDMFGAVMSETITVGAGAVTAYGNKAFKYVSSVTPQFTDAHNYSIGTADAFGFAIRSDYWEYMNVFWAGAFLTVSTGWTAADATSPATATTGDTRGTIQVGTVNKSGAGAAGGSADGTKRLAAFMSLPMYNAINANNLNYVTLFGTLQA